MPRFKPVTDLTGVVLRRKVLSPVASWKRSVLPASNAPWRERAVFASPIVFLMTLAFIKLDRLCELAGPAQQFREGGSGLFPDSRSACCNPFARSPASSPSRPSCLFMVMREQMLAYLSLIILGIGIAMTGYFPSFYGLLLTTTIMSIGFHYFETANQALALPAASRRRRRRAGSARSTAANAAAQLTAYGGIGAVYFLMEPSFEALFLVAGGTTILLAITAMSVFRRFQGSVPQNKGLVLRSRYWLYYVLTFLSGARRQLFMAFGGLLLVERFGYDVAGMARLLLPWSVP